MQHSPSKHEALGSISSVGVERRKKRKGIGRKGKEEKRGKKSLIKRKLLLLIN